MESTLAQVLAAIGEPLAEVRVAPAGLDVPVSGTAILDPDDDPADHPGRLVLVIGARGRDAVRPLRAAARRGAVAVAVKSAGTGGDEELCAAAADAGVALLAVRADVRWDHLEALVHGVVDDGPPAEADDAGDLYSLAQTVGRLTGGLVSIEDTASRVLAYSRSDSTSPDELRRRSILGWHGPADYLATLRGWGVFDRLRAGEEVVRVDEHAELGIRRRLAVGVHAGQRQLGTIWVQEGATPFAERAESVLLGAARVAAGHLIRRRSQQSPGARWSRDVVTGLLEGRVGADLVAATFGLDTAEPAVVVGFAVGTGAAEPGVAELGAAELAEVVSVHAATFRRGALTAPVGARVYAVLPAVDLPAVDADGVPPALHAMCAEVVAITGRRAGGGRVRAGIGSGVAGLAGVPASRADADRVLDAMPADADVAAIGDLRAEILLDEALARLGDLHDPAAAALLAHDAAHGSDLAASVLALLDALGDVRAAAARLTVHPNTLRYRLRRASEVAGLRLGDPAARVVHHLHLLRAARSQPARSRPTRPQPARS
ncbi:helix-turn-helix domain-containing protein [Pseudonocardia sp. KRD-184]|uniref:Helix-turn-helix domain-containing protein n=1 Tax=Pseudonocardia oceani TaxID=2792013 RepID=A0ABS6UDK8_9PSEU|nr:helix-turn-helix domain-containing protein [Pseudonocardia oceani]MBW0089383.1 helix-turn-helix domain-containing protein [Pseudonocardia oceani]MBW0098793.1 helix-turn-helix domain-containing protein [Pseudonocardia oceani]MBW0107744.1 helix-turn-helix domain-containing protein [Pseudonocardia oceani]MBW0123287.1 helix-turn-helix domain-containing protein [Pseudonocardia oceani]MBW0130321.1 helix-turn-helix domain-containing protein [Pseudonocardia oceani]